MIVNTSVPNACELGSLGEWTGASILGLARAGEPAPAGRRRTICWSGSMAEVDLGESGLFGADVRTWASTGWRYFERALGEFVDAGSRVTIRPHARHVVSDVPGCARLLREWGGAGVALLADPVSMLTEEMFDRGTGAEVLRRAFEALATEPMSRGLAGVVIGNARPDERSGIRVSALMDGLFEPGTVARLAAEFVPAGVPVVLEGSGVREQFELLRVAGMRCEQEERSNAREGRGE